MLRRSFLSILPSISLFGLNKQNLWPEFIKNGDFLARNDHNEYHVFDLSIDTNPVPYKISSKELPKKSKYGFWYQDCVINYKDTTSKNKCYGIFIAMKIFGLMDLLQPGTMMDRAGNIYYE